MLYGNVINPLGGVWKIYCLLPAFIFSSLVIVIVSICTKSPDTAITEEFDAVRAG